MPCPLLVAFIDPCPRWYRVVRDAYLASLATTARRSP